MLTENFVAKNVAGKEKLLITREKNSKEGNQRFNMAGKETLLIAREKHSGGEKRALDMVGIALIAIALYRKRA